MKKRIISFVLAALMLTSVMPVHIAAASNDQSANNAMVAGEKYTLDASSKLTGSGGQTFGDVEAGSVRVPGEVAQAILLEVQSLSPDCLPTKISRLSIPSK